MEASLEHLHMGKQLSLDRNTEGEDYINNLPNEVLTLIFSTLSEKDLASVGQTNKRWQELTNELEEHPVTEQIKKVKEFKTREEKKKGSKKEKNNVPINAHIAISSNRSRIAIIDQKLGDHAVTLFKTDIDEANKKTFKFDQDIEFLGFQGEDLICLGKKGIYVFNTKLNNLEVISDVYFKKNEILHFYDETTNTLAYFFPKDTEGQIYHSRKIQTVTIKIHSKSHKCKGLIVNGEHLMMVYEKLKRGKIRKNLHQGLHACHRISREKV